MSGLIEIDENLAKVTGIKVDADVVGPNEKTTRRTSRMQFGLSATNVMQSGAESLEEDLDASTYPLTFLYFVWAPGSSVCSMSCGIPCWCVLQML